MELILVRHGAADVPAGRIVGVSDPPLAPAGAAAIRALVAGTPAASMTVAPLSPVTPSPPPTTPSLTSAVPPRPRAVPPSGRFPVPPDRLISSDLRRAADSAAILAAHWALPVGTDPRLRELDFGEWEGRDWTELERHDHARLMAWMERWWERRPPGGETFPELRGRVVAWLDDLLRDAQRRTANATTGTAVGDRAVRYCVVTHAGVIRALLTHLLDISVERAFQLTIDCAGVTILACAADRFELRRLNASRWE